MLVILPLFVNTGLLICAVPSIQASPTPVPANTSSASQYVAWYSPPNERGTWDILTSCILTMSLCIWTALHLNIPTSSDDLAKMPLRSRIYFSKAGRQARWIFMGLLAPELVVYAAWEERREVKIITSMAHEAQTLVSC